MAEDLIDSYVDRSGVKSDTDYIVSQLREVYGEFKKLESVKLDLKGAAGLTQIIPAMGQAKTGLDSLATATQAVEQRIAQMNGKSKEFTQVLLQQAKAQKEASTAALNEAKAATELAKAKQIEAKATEQSTKAKEAEKKLIDQVSNDYLQLSKAYNEAALKAKNYYVTLGEAHPVTVQAIKDASDIGNVLKKADAAVGQFQRNVGNYKSAFDGLGFSFAQIGRELPSLAINVQTFALAISNNLPIVADELRKASEEIKRLKAEGKETPSLFQRIGKAVFSLQTLLSVGITLFTVFAGKIFGAGSAARTAADDIKTFSNSVDDANDSLERFNRSRKTELDINTEKLKQAGKTETEINNARVKGYLEEGKLFKALYEDKNKSLNEFAQKVDAATGGQTKLLNSFNQQTGRATTSFEILDKISKLKLSGTYDELSKKNKASIDALEESAKKVESILNKSDEAFRTAELESQRNQTRLSEDAKNKAKSDADAAKMAADLRLQALTEIQALELQRTIDFNKEIASNEEKGLFERLSALRVAKDAEVELILLRANTEKQLGRKTAEEIKLIEAERNDALIRLARDFSTEREKIKKEEADALIAEEDRVRKALEKGIDESYKKWAKAEEDRTRKQKEEADKRLKQEEEEAKAKEQLQKQLITELSELTFTLFTAGIERQKNAIQEQIDLLEDRKQKEIEVANQTFTNTQERAAAIAVIEARAQAQREALQRRQRDLDVKKAQFDKAASVARIIQETAFNVVKYFANPFLAALAGAIGAAQLAAVIAQPIPRYKHGKNVNDLYEGPAIVGDGGKKEAIIRENGNVEITASTPQLTYVKKRDIVLPDAAMLSDLVVSGQLGGKLIERTTVVDSDNVEAAIKKMEGSVVGAIKRIPQPVIKVENLISRRVRHGDSSNQYLNKNLQQ